MVSENLVGWLHWKISGPGSFENAIDVYRRLPVRIDDIDTVKNQATVCGRTRDSKDGGKLVASREIDDQFAFV